MPICADFITLLNLKFFKAMGKILCSNGVKTAAEWGFKVDFFVFIEKIVKQQYYIQIHLEPNPISNNILICNNQFN